VARSVSVLPCAVGAGVVEAIVHSFQPAACGGVTDAIVALPVPSTWPVAVARTPVSVVLGEGVSVVPRTCATTAEPLGNASGAGIEAIHLTSVDVEPVPKLAQPLPASFCAAGARFM